MSALRQDLPNYTFEDYQSWEGHWEIIDGVVYAMAPAPSLYHQSISHKIARLLGQALDRCEQCTALLPVDWKIAENTVVQPDNLVVCYPLEGNYLTKAPSLIFEVLSKSTAIKDQNTKFALYEQEGVPYYVLVSQDDKVAKVYQLQQGKYIKLADVDKETITFDLGKCQIEFDFSKIW
jgi:Uma2 family endonuclease